MSPNPRIGRLMLLVNLAFMEASTIKDNPSIGRVLKHQFKRAFGMYWNVSRAMLLEYDKAVAQAKAEQSVDLTNTLMYEVVDAVFKSPDPAQSLALLQAFNKGEVQVTE